VPVLLFVGRLVKQKGVYDLLDALPWVLERAPCHLLIAGEGPEEAGMRAAVARLGLDRHVTFAGYLRGAELSAAYRAASALVLPTFWGEGFPTVVSEAMYAGLPVVTTPIRGAADELTEGTHVLFTPAHDATALANTLIRLLEDPALRAAMAGANRDKVRDFAPKPVARRYRDAIAAVIAEKS
jgi:glycosyltransferase involved in cell wall biosynthesis